MSKLKNYGKLNVPDFVWWVGIVESRADITKTGRYRVRIFGYHTPNTEDLPVKDLPYAPVINSVTTAGTSGIGETPNLLPGSTVIGFFSDGDEAQMPVILGSIAGLPAEKNEDLTVEDGFNDPNKKYPLLMFQYSGPGSQQVSNRWGDSRTLWHKDLANQGYIVACVDGRGTGFKGSEFKKMTYLNLVKYESLDQIAVAKTLGQLPFVDNAQRQRMLIALVGQQMALGGLFAFPFVDDLDDIVRLLSKSLGLPVTSVYETLNEVLVDDAGLDPTRRFPAGFSW